ncbi:MAG: hypothetical protein J1F28_02855 [Oscillospiraceae bacterium]|nr:hypothetical protein [Oscillospiraceae bacterium]
MSDGCISLIQVWRSFDEKGVEYQPMCEVDIIYREPIKKLWLNVNDIYHKDTALRKVLEDNGISFRKDGFRLWCEKFSEEVHKATPQICYLDFYKDSEGRWHHSKDKEIAQKAADSLGILERLGIDFTEISDDSFLRLTLLLYGICGSLAVVIRSMGITPIAKPTIVYPEGSVALNDLKALYCSDSNYPLIPDKSFEIKILTLRNEVVLVQLSNSEYMSNKCLEALSNHDLDLTALPILLSENEKYFSGRNDILLLNYDITAMGCISDIQCWAVRALLNDSSLDKRIKNSFDRYFIMLEQDTETVSVRNLVALLMAMAEVYLPRMGVIEEKLVSVMQKYYRYLTESVGSSSVIKERLKEFLLSRRDIPIKPYRSDSAPRENVIYSKDDMLLFPRSAFIHTAKRCGTNGTSLAELLSNNDILMRNTGGNTLNMRHGGNTYRMYAVKCSELFDIGELRPMCVNEFEPKPLYKLPIGEVNGYEIFFDIYSCNSKNNNSFALITGVTGSGKSTLCETIAVKAAEEGLAVVCLGVEDPFPYSDYNFFEPAEDEEVSLKRFSEELYAMLSDEEKELADTALELIRELDLKSYEDILNNFTALIYGEECKDSLLAKASDVFERISGFSWKKAVIDGEISRVVVHTREEADRLLLDFFNYKAKQAEVRYTILLLDEVQEFSWDGKSPLVSKILRQGRKYGIVGILSTQYLTADNGKNIASALKQIETHFVFRPSDALASAKQLGYTSDKDFRIRNVLEMLDAGKVMAKGHISTEICALNYPVRFTVNKEET